MDLEKQKEYVATIQKCQRNWDDFEIPKQHIEHFIHLASNSPTKQHEAYFNFYVVTNKILLENLLEHTWGFTYPINNQTSQDDVPCNVRNPQVGASAYFLWTSKWPDTNRNFTKDGKNRPNTHQNRKDNSLTSIGISMGLVAFSAASLGYVTAFNKNHTKPGSEGFIKETLQISDDEEITYGLGIGKGKPGYSHNQSDESRLMVGWPDWQIIDTNTEQFEYQGNTYEVRDNITYPSFSSQTRNINYKWIE